MLDNYQQAAFYNVDQLAQEIGVSNATVVRLAYKLGYPGFSALQRQIQNMVKQKISLVDRFDERILVDEDKQSIFRKSIERDLENIRATYTCLNDDTLQDSVEVLLEAKHIYTFGQRSSYALAYYAAFYFNQILNNTTLLSTNEGCYPEQLLKMSTSDLLITFCFPRYSKLSFNITKFAHENQVKTMVITDNLIGPLTPYADLVLPCRYEGVSYYDSSVAAVCIINAIAAGLAKAEVGKVKKSLQKIERAVAYWDFFIDK